MANILTRFFNRSKKAARRITEGSNIARPGATVILSAPRRFGLSIDQYMEAVRAAENPDYTHRVRLYDLYADIETDTHVIAVTQKRTGAVKSVPIEFRRDGVPVPEVNDQIRSPWFLRFLEDAFEARYWGFSLFQFYRNEQGWIDYYLVPRKHVDPVLRVIHHRQGDPTGTPFDDYDNLLFVGDKRPLGLYLSLCPWVIWKRDAFGDWAQFSELFGIPIRKYTYDAADPEALQACADAAAEQGNSAVMFVPVGSNLELVETAGAAASSDLYDTRTARCNAEISKAILGNTLTTESSENGTQALGTVHAKEEAELAAEDRQFILNLLNYEMTDIFRSLGVAIDGGEFVYVAGEDPSVMQQRAQNLRTLVLDFGLPVAPDVIYETLGIEKPKEFSAADWQLRSAAHQDDPSASTGGVGATPDAPASGPTEQPVNAAQTMFKHRFFGDAPRGGASVSW